MEIHFVAAVDFMDGRLRPPILRGMKKYKIKKVMLTTFDITRGNLITKARMEDYCNGKMYQKDSVNDDVESLFEAIQNGEKPTDGAYTYFLPKLTQKELKMVERKDENFMKTLRNTFTIGNADVYDAEMKASESNSKYVYGFGHRATFTIENLLKCKNSS